MHRSIKASALAAAVSCPLLLLLPGNPADAATFLAPVVVSANNITEPGVEIGPGNVRYVHGPSGIPIWSQIWRSEDAGATWFLTPNVTRAGLGGGDIDIAVQPGTGKLAFTDLWLGSSSVGISSDKGQTWVTNQLQGTVVQDRQWVQTTGRDITYHVTHQLAAGLVVGKSVEGGLTYPVQTLAASTLDQGNCLCPPGYLIAEAGTQPLGIDDKVGVIYTTATGVKFARSSNGALTWAQSTIDSTGGGSTLEAFPVVANAGNGNLVAAWLDVTNSASRVMFSESLNWGVSWSAPTAIVSAGTSVFPWIDAKGGKVAVSLYHNSSTGTKPDNVPNSSSWHLKYLERNNGTWDQALTVADPTAVKSGPICTDGLNCGSDRELGDFQMVALDANSKANISYVRSINGANDTEVRFVKQS